MNIAHLLSSFAVGGQERVALDLASGQIALGHRVLAVSLAPPPDGPLAAELRARGATVLTVPKGEGVDATLPLRLARVLRAQGVDILHTHNPQPLIYGTVAARLSGASLVHTKHGANPDRGRRLLLRQAAGHLASAYVAVSAATAEVARANRECEPDRLHVIDNGIDLGRFGPDPKARAEVRASLGIPASAWLIGSVGRLAREKAYPTLVEAAAPLLSGNTRLVFVGDGSERQAIEEKARALGVSDKVVLAGLRSDVPRVLAALDTFALSSVTEGLPLVIPEAMATGLPVVSTAVGGIPAVVIDGETGRLAPPSDPQALGKALAELAHDPERARAMGERGRTIALDRYSAERMVQSYLALYQNVLPRGIRTAA